MKVSGQLGVSCGRVTISGCDRKAPSCAQDYGGMTWTRREEAGEAGLSQGVVYLRGCLLFPLCSRDLLRMSTFLYIQHVSGEGMFIFQS